MMMFEEICDEINGKDNFKYIRVPFESKIGFFIVVIPKS